MEQSRAEVFVGELQLGKTKEEEPYYAGERLNFRGKKTSTVGDHGRTSFSPYTNVSMDIE